MPGRQKKKWKTTEEAATAARDQESHVLQTAQDALSENIVKEEATAKIQRKEVLVATDHAERSEKALRK